MSSTPPIVCSGEPGGLCDFFVPLASVRRTDVGALYVVAKGTHHGEETTFAIRLVAEIRAGLANGRPDPTAFQENGISLVSYDAASRPWLRCLAAGWGVEIPADEMAVDVPFTSFAMHEAPWDLDAEQLHFKLMTGTSEEGTYAEWFMNLDLVSGVVGFVEKEVRYRMNLMRALIEPQL